MGVRYGSFTESLSEAFSPSYFISWEAAVQILRNAVADRGVQSQMKVIINYIDACALSVSSPALCP